MSKILVALLITCTLATGTCVLATGAVHAATTPTPATAATPTTAADAADPRAALLKVLPPGSKLEDLKLSPIAGLYEFSQGADVSYITADGKYFFDGNVYDMSTRENLTEAHRARSRLALISAVPESQMVIFAPKNPQYTITVFTDVDCQYCRKLHSQMAELNKLGIRVRYLFYPRTGPNTESWRKAEAVWCAPDRNAALTQAKLGAPVDTKKLCANTPVARDYALGQNIGLRGTPGIVTETGEYISGYLPPEELIQELKQEQSKPKG